MRPVNEIRAEIDKLVKELDEVKLYDAKRTSAVHILSNLGWTHTPKDGWKAPKTATAPKYDEYSPQWTGGDFVYTKGRYYRVHSCVGVMLTVQEIRSVSPVGMTVDPFLQTLRTAFVNRVTAAHVLEAFTK